ncbi:MAG: hypothetical protein FGM39_09830 [Phycisphaerales bacterium]|nr:hypothetical protein [Phycisphaerales bacterium]
MSDRPTAGRMLAALLAAAAILAGCTSDGVQVDASTRSVKFVPAFDGRALLEAQPAACAVLPALAPYQQGLGPVTGMTLMRAIEHVDPKARVQAGGIVLGRLNAAGLAAAWRDLASGYVVSGVLERTELAKIAEAAGARYLLMPMLGTMTTKTDTRLTFAGLVLGRTTSTTVDVSLQVWDSATGELAWASTGWCSLEAEVVLATRASLNRALEAVWVQMVTDLAEGRSRSVVSVTERTTPEERGTSAGAGRNADPAGALDTPQTKQHPKD